MADSNRPPLVAAIGLRPILACPTCRGPLADDVDGLACEPCAVRYPVRDGVPILLAGAVAAPEGIRSSRIEVGQSAWVRAAKRIIRVPSPTFETGQLRAQLPSFLARFPHEAVLASVGSADLRYGRNLTNIDLIHTPGVDLVGDATRLPLATGSVDGIVCRRVLEHVRKPSMAVTEFLRVLKPGGMVWCEIPFMQGFHPTPTDFQRYTRDGLEDLFDQFEIVDSGVALGPSSTLSWVLREYLAILFAFNSPLLYRINERLFSWLTLPVKFLDVFTSRSRFAGQIASSFYIVARKPAAAPDEHPPHPTVLQAT